MLIVYLSLTGNVRSFVEKTGMASKEISYANPLIKVNEPYIVVVPSYDDEITETVSAFIDNKGNKAYLQGFAGSGSLNYSDKYCFNAKDLADKYAKPLLYTFEFSGTDQDINHFKEEVTRLAIS